MQALAAPPVGMARQLPYTAFESATAVLVCRRLTIFGTYRPTVTVVSEFFYSLYMTVKNL